LASDSDEVGQLEGVGGRAAGHRSPEQALERREAVEGALGGEAGDAGDLVEHAVHELAAPGEGGPHLVHGLEVAGDGGQRRPLRHVGDVGGLVALEVGGRLDDVLRDRSSSPPASPVMA
jgi:hypothetical protein